MTHAQLKAAAQDPDLFGVPAKVRAKYPANGYAARPGTGPEGETCKTCAFIARRRITKKVFIKCGRMCHQWTNSYGTDIRANSPACRRWEKYKKNVDPCLVDDVGP